MLEEFKFFQALPANEQFLLTLKKSSNFYCHDRNQS